MSRAALVTVLAALTTFALVAAPAQAGYLAPDDDDPSVLHFWPGSSETSNVQLFPESGSTSDFRLTDSNPITETSRRPLPAGCTRHSDQAVICSPANYSGITAWLGAGNDSFIATYSALPLTVGGNEGNDTLTGAAAADVLMGGEHDDSLEGGAGEDELFGNEGTDLLNDGPGEDYLDGGAGNDILIASAGKNRLFGDAGHDQLTGGAGYDYLDGGADNDVLTAGAGGAQLEGDAGDDLLFGGPAGDTMTGGLGRDIFDSYGGGSDAIYARDGDCDAIRADTDDIIWTSDLCDRSAWSKAGPRAVIKAQVRNRRTFALRGDQSWCNGCRIKSYRWSAGGKRISNKARARYKLPRGKTRATIKLVVIANDGTKDSAKIKVRRGS